MMNNLKVKHYQALHLLLAVWLATAPFGRPNPAYAELTPPPGKSELLAVGQSLLHADLIFDRFLGAGVLLGLADCTGLPILMAGLEADDPIVVRAAADTLLTSGASSLFPAINRRALKNAATGEAVLWSLTENFRPEFKPLILRTLKEDKGERRRAAILALAKSDDSVFLPDLLAFLDRTGVDAASRAYSLYAVAALGAGSRVRDQIINNSRAEQPMAREMAAVSLGYMEDAASRGALENLGNDLVPHVRIAALASAARLGDESAAVKLEAVILSDDVHAATLASASLKRLPPRQAAAVIERSFSSHALHPDIVLRLLESWASVRGEGASSAAIGSAGLAHPDHDVRLLAIWALGKRAGAGTGVLASPFLNDPDAALRGMAAWALVQIGHNQPANRGADQNGVQIPVCDPDATQPYGQKRIEKNARHAE